MAKPAKRIETPKAADRVRARMSEELKGQLQTVLDEHPHFRGNLSEFFNACAQAAVLQYRRGELPAYPIEFLPRKP